jgi:hypothetical protein
VSPDPRAPQRDALEAETRDAIRRIHYYGYPPDERLAADVEADVEEIVAPLFALLARVTGERATLRDAAERAVDWFDRFAAEPEDTTVMHQLQEALGQTVEHDRMRCRCE